MTTNYAGNALGVMRHRYKVSQLLKTYSIYNLEAADAGNLLTDVLRIENFRGKSNATGIDKYLRLRTSTSWERSLQVTGLRPSKVPGVYYGDHRTLRKSKSLLVFAFSNDGTRLIIDVYPGFYPFTPSVLQKLILGRYSR